MRNCENFVNKLDNIFGSLLAPAALKKIQRVWMPAASASTPSELERPAKWAGTRRKEVSFTGSE
jgi:hypothetical protein